MLNDGITMRVANGPVPGGGGVNGGIVGPIEGGTEDGAVGQGTNAGQVGVAAGVEGMGTLPTLGVAGNSGSSTDGSSLGSPVSEAGGA